ncbi:class I SAM-dependent methyltransferase [Streptomyces sp. NPDC001594]|uniref:class I SAM-dependent methyltransferase n=1 Tax=Streptomyces sp. NPDC001594 TaxID=3364590 RepID=UPI0036906F80
MNRFVRALARFHAGRPWDHNAQYHRWILRRLPPRFGSALDVGAGSGELARLLASRARAVRGIDVDAGIVGRARELTDAAAPVVFGVGDVLEGVQGGPYDVVTCVAAVHHMPIGDGLARLRECLAPGGTLVVVGLYRPRTWSDHLIGAAAVPANVAMAWVKNRGRKRPRPVSMTAPTRPAETTFAEIVREARRTLPGARLRRRLFWRYTLTWHRP